MKAHEVMEPVTHHLKPDDGLREFLRTIKDARAGDKTPWVKTLPVLDTHGKPIGMLSMTDILKTIYPRYLYTTDLSMFTWDGMLETLASHATGKKVADLMTRPVITVLEDHPLMECLDRMLKHGISTVPVVDHAQRLIGMLYKSDLFFVITAAMLGETGEKS